MSQACYCNRCSGCRAAWEAGERYDTTEDEAREEAERAKDEFAALQRDPSTRPTEDEIHDYNEDAP